MIFSIHFALWFFGDISCNMTGVTKTSHGMVFILTQNSDIIIVNTAWKGLTLWSLICMHHDNTSQSQTASAACDPAWHHLETAEVMTSRDLFQCLSRSAWPALGAMTFVCCLCRKTISLNRSESLNRTTQQKSRSKNVRRTRRYSG